MAIREIFSQKLGQPDRRWMDQAAAWLDVLDYGGGQGCAEGQGCGVWPVVDHHVERELGSDDDLEKSGGEGCRDGSADGHVNLRGLQGG